MSPVKALNDEQFQYLLGGLAGPYERRDRAALTLAYNTGLRVAELVGLNHGDVLRAGGVVELLHVRAEIAKGGRPREVPLNRKAKDAITALVDFNRENGHDVGPGAPLLVGRRGKRLGVRMVQHIVEAARGDLTWVTVHTLRHSFATRVQNSARNIRVTQTLLGHKNLNTTQIYTHVTMSDLAGAVNSI